VSNPFERRWEDGDPPVILLESVSVGYRVPQERIGTFKEYAIRRVKGQIANHEFLALRSVNLEVRKGEVFGVVGRNGAGKSTMLKVVSRVLRPTAGRVVVRGQVAPLLELGAGFHPELTGRENIYLNGTLIGHSRREIEAAFETITAFADLGEFIETPLRTYSSGMIARLGFAVASAWKPDILILDEVLAVGDEAFQRKCFERMRSFREGGSTVLMVSHNAATIREMCSRAAWLDHGIVQAVGPAVEVTEAYQRSLGA
jgi:ABC-type polysaccharide/polyol phosphate transport system ATPase subunit